MERPAEGVTCCPLDALPAIRVSVAGSCVACCKSYERIVAEEEEARCALSRGGSRTQLHSNVRLPSDGFVIERDAYARTTIDRFSELALMLPYTDITLVMYGAGVKQIVDKAKRTAPQSLAAKSSPASPVHSYTAPEESGASTINIFLDGRQDDWPVGEPEMLDYNGMPDAIVSPNAGLLSYPAWHRVIVYCFGQETPFAVTEYAEQSAETQRDALPMIVGGAIAQIGSSFPPQARANAMRPGREHPIAFNPFSRPGQRGVPCSRLPNVPNGFTLKVVG